MAIPRLSVIIATGLIIALALPFPFKVEGSQQADKPHHGSGIYQAESTRRMVQRLEEIGATDVDRIFASVLPGSLSQYVRQVKSPPDLRSNIILEAKAAHELLTAGKVREAAERFIQIKKQVAENSSLFDSNFAITIKKLLASAYLRLGEQENCISNHTSESCLMPIRGTGIYSMKNVPRLAIKEYSELLKQSPDDLTSRWLLNISYMTIGEYPQGVPKDWLLPPDLFKSDYVIKRFPDIAPQLGLTVSGKAGGTIIEDFDGDDLLDIMASSSGMNQGRDQLRYFHNDGDGKFSERSTEAGLKGIVGGLHICTTDYNNDGNVDVFIPRGSWLANKGHHPPSLLRNNGNGTFDDVTEEAGLLYYRPSAVAVWADYDKDGFLDLFAGSESIPAAGEINPCQLFHNNGDGTFTDVASSLGVATVGYVRGAGWGDYDNDGLPDLYISRLDGGSFLFHNNGKDSSGQWSFTDVTEKAGVQQPYDGFACWFWDYDNDGWLDIYVNGYTADNLTQAPGQVAADYMGMPFWAETPRLYRNNHDGTFTNVTQKARLNHPVYSMGCNFGDIDNDGWLDFYVGTGSPNYDALIPNRMFRNAGGKFFQDVTTSGGFGHLQKGHGISFGDLDNDGDLDIYAQLGGMYAGDIYQNALFRNPGNGNHWVELKLQGVRSNRAALGARIKVTVQNKKGTRSIYSTVTTGSSFGTSPLQQLIGLEQAVSIRSIEITWPIAGSSQVFKDVKMDRAYKIREGDPELSPMMLKRFKLGDKPQPEDVADMHQHHEHK